jgi:hypothetical protein
MNFKAATKIAIGILSLLSGYVDAGEADALIKGDDGVAAARPSADHPLRMSRKSFNFPPIIGGGKAPARLNSTQQDVGAQIVGGDPVDPREYKVRTTLSLSLSSC